MLLLTVGFALNDASFFGKLIRLRFATQKQVYRQNRGNCGRAVGLTSTKRNFQEFQKLDFNDPENRVESPSGPSVNVVQALFRVYRAVSDFLLLKDLFSLFSKLEKMLVDFYLKPMKAQVFIKTEIAHQILVQELDYIKDNAKDLFLDKITLDYKMIDSVCREIESEKTVYLMP